MWKDLSKIINSFNIKIESSYFNELIESFNLTGNSSLFIYDVLSDSSLYVSPSVINILGCNYRRYLNKNFIFFKTIIHPADFPFLVEKIVTLIKIENNHNNSEFSSNDIELSMRIKHKNGEWIKTNIQLIYHSNRSDKNTNVLIGFIERDLSIRDFNFLNSCIITSREMEVFKHLASGNSAKMIADKLYISENTVVTHRKNLIQKLKVKNSAELIKKGFELNILN